MNKTLPSTAFGTLALLAALLAPGVARAEAGVGPQELLVGQSITLQGGKNAYGVAAAEGARVAIDSANAAGGVYGRRVVLRVLDDDNQSATAEANARRLVQDGVYVLFGSIEGGPSTAVMKVAVESRVPFFGPMAGPPALRRPHQELVFPVRAEHREEFRELMGYGKTLGLKSVAFFHADTAVGAQHVANVKLIVDELGMDLRTLLPFGADAGDAQIEAMVATLKRDAPDMIFNHGSAGLYQKLVARMKAAGLKTVAMGVNSGSSQIARGLGPLAQGMVFSQVVPSPWERKRALTREYQDVMRRFAPQSEFSYGSLEGFMTAKALLAGLRSAGREPTRASFIAGLEGSSVDLGGVAVRYARGDHEGSRFIDLSMVARDGRFLH